MARKNSAPSGGALKSVASEPKTLLPVEFERLERYRLLQDLRSREAQILALRAKTLDDQARIFDLMMKNLELERRALADEHDRLVERQGQDRAGHEATLAEVRTRLDLKGRFAYNPDTLEVFDD